MKWLSERKSETAAMLARTAKTHIRFGNFEYFHYNNKPEHVKVLADFALITILLTFQEQKIHTKSSLDRLLNKQQA